jgi:hypothetical protein
LSGLRRSEEKNRKGTDHLERKINCKNKIKLLKKGLSEVVKTEKDKCLLVLDFIGRHIMEGKGMSKGCLENR